MIKKRKQNNVLQIKVPHTCVIIFFIIILAAILTYIIPAGTYSYTESPSGTAVVDPESFTYVKDSPVSVYQLFNAIPTGLVDMASLIFFVFIAGGTFSIINETKTLHIAINKAAIRLNGKEKLMIVMIMTIFSLFGGLMGFSTECILFIPLGIALARKVGYDSIVGTAVILMGAYVGFVCGTFNPYTTAVAQGIVGLPVFSGLGLRVVFHIVTLCAACMYTIHYAEKVRRDPSKSYTYSSEGDSSHDTALPDKAEDFRIRNILVLLTMVTCFGIIIYGALQLSWSTKEMAPILFAMGIISGILGGLKANQIAEAWLAGAKNMIFAGLVIGMGRGVLVIMQDGLIMDTLVYWMAGALRLLPSSLTAVGMLICNIIINFFVPSGSGQATLVMPIMGPLAQICGISLQTAVLAFQCGDGFTNAVVPTSSVTAGCIGVARIGFIQWLRFSLPLVAIEWGLSIVFLIIAGMIGY